MWSHCWLEGSIPSDPVKLANMVGKGATPDLVRGLIHLFKIDKRNPSRLLHSRLEKERKKQRAWKKKSSDGGKKGALKRWGARGSNKPEANGGGYEMVNGESLPKHDSSSPSASPTPVCTPTPNPNIYEERQPIPEAPSVEQFEKGHEIGSKLVRYLNHATGMTYSEAGDYMNLIANRVCQVKFDYVGLKRMIDVKVNEWKGTKFQKGLNPGKLFGPEFDTFYGQRGMVPANGVKKFISGTENL